MIYKTVDESEYEITSFNQRINGKPVVTRYGLLRQPMMNEWDKMMEYISLLRKYPDAIKQDLFELKLQHESNKNILKRFREDLNKHDAVHFILQDKFKVGKRVREMIDFFFIETNEYLDGIIFDSDNSWNEFRLYMLDFYGWGSDSESGDETVRHFQKLKSYLDNVKGRAISFETMYTVVMEWYNPKDINELTVYQFKQFFNRMVKKESHRTTALFKTVDSKGDLEVVNYLESDIKERKISFLDISGSDVGKDNKTEKSI